MPQRRINNNILQPIIFEQVTQSDPRGDLAFDVQYMHSMATASLKKSETALKYIGT